MEQIQCFNVQPLAPVGEVRSADPGPAKCLVSPEAFAGLLLLGLSLLCSAVEGSVQVSRSLQWRCLSSSSCAEQAVTEQLPLTC